MDAPLLADLLGLVCLLLLVDVARLRGGRWLATMRGRARARRAVRGERDAEKLLRRNGYRIVARQAEGQWAPRIDGAPEPVRLRADLLVARLGKRYLAEVKTGEVAPSIQHAGTRRQLLEYRVAFPVDGVLLVVPERAAIYPIHFPGLDTSGPRRPRIGGAIVFLVGLAVGLALAHQVG